MNATETIWSSALANIARTVTPEQFETWFKDVSLAAVTPERAVIRVPNAFYRKWFEMHYSDLIAAALEAETGTRPAVRLEIAPRELSPAPAPGTAPAPGATPPPPDCS